MALIKCPECEKEISDKVKTCPHCGYKTKRISKKTILIVFAIVLIASLTASMVFFLPKWMTAQKYSKGIDLLKSKNYSQAIECFANVTKKQYTVNDDKFDDINCLIAFSNAKNTYISTKNEIERLTVSTNYLQEIPINYDGIMSDEIIEFKNSLKLELDKFEEKERVRKETLEKERIKKEALEREEENKVAFIKEVTECPLPTTSARLTYNAIDHPQVAVSIKNNSQKTIDAFTINFYLYDNFNNPVNHYLYDNNIFKGISQQTIRSGDTLSSHNYFWTPYGHENTSKFLAFVTEIHYEDNSTWSMSKGAIEYAKIYSDSAVENINFE